MLPLRGSDMLIGTSPVPQAPTATTSGFGLPRCDGPRLDQGCTSPQVMRSVRGDRLERYVSRRTGWPRRRAITVGEVAGGVMVP